MKHCIGDTVPMLNHEHYLISIIGQLDCRHPIALEILTTLIVNIDDYFSLNLSAETFGRPLDHIMGEIDRYRN